MADSSARKIKFEPNRQIRSVKRTRIAIDPHQVRWTGLEKTLICLGSVITLGMMIFSVSSSISATSAQQELSKTQQTIAKQRNEVADLQQQVGELTSSSRLNKIARSKGLSLIEGNIRTIR